MARIYAGTNLKIKGSLLPRSKKRIIFYTLMLLLPLIQFAIFYIYVNFQSITMAFMSYENDAGDGAKFVGFENFKTVFKIIGQNPKLVYNSLTLAFFMLLVALPLAILFSYYLYKNRFLHKFFKVVLFLPQIVSGVVFAMITTLFIGAIEMVMIKNGSATTAFNPFGNSPLLADQRMVALIIFTVWMSFGVNVLLFSGAMANINPSLVEAAELDGCNVIQEFFHVTIPSIFPTIVSFVVVTVSGIFVNQMFLMEFAQAVGTDCYTIGYYLYYQAKNSALGGPDLGGLYDLDTTQPFPVLSALSLLITIVLLPATLLIKKALNKLGPSTR